MAKVFVMPVNKIINAKLPYHKYMVIDENSFVLGIFLARKDAESFKKLKDKEKPCSQK